MQEVKPSDECAVFVYGTLMTEEHLHRATRVHILRRGEAIAVGRKRSVDGLERAWFDKRIEIISGHLLWFSSEEAPTFLTDLDRFENVAPNLYQRIEIEVINGSAIVHACAYEATSHSLGDWNDYLGASRRKIDIAEYHLKYLVGLNPDLCQEDDHGRPPIELQAPFEGVLYSFIASTDQLAEAINLKCGLNLDQPVLQKAAEQMPRSSPRREILKWMENPLAKDVRLLRRKVVHHHYGKTPQGLKWMVEKPQESRYHGKREAVPYSQNVVEHLKALHLTIERLESRVANGSDL